MKTAIFTIARSALLPQAKLLLDSCQKFLGDADTIAVVAERTAVAREISHWGRLGHRVLSLDELGSKSIDELAFQYGESELPGALKPAVFRHLLEHGYEAAIFFDPEIEIFSRPVELLERLATNSALLVPHVTEPLPRDGFFPSNEQILRLGQFNSAFCAFSKYAESGTFLKMWEEELRLRANVDPEQLWKGEQFFLAAVPTLLSNSHIIRGSSFQITEWNLPQRVLRESDGLLCTDDGPVVFMNFVGLPRKNLSRGTAPWAGGFLPPGSVPRPIPSSAALAKALESRKRRLSAAKAALSPLENRYSYGYFSTGEAIISDDRSNYLRLGPLEKASLGNPFEARIRLRSGVVSVFNRRNAAALSIEIEDMRRSATWRAGRFVTWPLRKAKAFFQLHVRWLSPRWFAKVERAAVRILGGTRL